MKKGIFLNSKEEITLLMILDQFVDVGRELFWFILEQDLLGDFGDTFNQIFLQVREEGKMSTFMTWDELYEIASKCEIIISLTLIGCKNKTDSLEIYKFFMEPKEHYPMPKDVLPLYEILVDIDDGDLRAVLSKDKRIQERCLKEFGPYPVGVYRDLTNE